MLLFFEKEQSRTDTPIHRYGSADDTMPRVKDSQFTETTPSHLDDISQVCFVSCCKTCGVVCSVLSCLQAAIGLTKSSTASLKLTATYAMVNRAECMRLRGHDPVPVFLTIARGSDRRKPSCSTPSRQARRTPANSHSKLNMLIFLFR